MFYKARSRLGHGWTVSNWSTLGEMKTEGKWDGTGEAGDLTTTRTKFNYGPTTVRMDGTTSVIQEAYIQGISNRSVDDLARSIGMDGISKS